MMPLALPSTWSIALVLAVACGASGYYAGYRYSDNACQASQSKRLAVALAEQQAADARGNALTTALIQKQSQIDQFNQEAHRAITQATSGRTCLDSAALRVLNSAPGITVMPAPTGSVAAAGEAPVAAGGDSAWYSTDTQIALWSADTGAAFEVCRARLDALIDWNTAP